MCAKYYALYLKNTWDYFVVKDYFCFEIFCVYFEYALPHIALCFQLK